MIQVLQDVENVCNRVTCAPLHDAVDDLRPLMSSANTVVRNMTYTLLLRCLGDNPHTASELLPDYLDCLDSDDAAVVSTALQRLPDFLLLCQGANYEAFISFTFIFFFLQYLLSSCLL